MADIERPTSSSPAPVESESSPMQPSSPMDRRRSSAEWDASKVPPSRFQKRKGSIYAVPSSRDGHIDSNYNHKFHEKHKELWKDLTGANNANTNPSNGNS